jgi:hypothetical protein
MRRQRFDAIDEDKTAKPSIIQEKFRTSRPD